MEMMKTGFARGILLPGYFTMPTAFFLYFWLACPTGWIPGLQYGSSAKRIVRGWWSNCDWV